MKQAQRSKAAEAYAATGNASHAAREAKVNRSTVVRWLEQEDFQDLVASLNGSEPSPTATRALADLVPKAVNVVEKGLEGEATVSAARVALDVIKVAAQLGPKEGSLNETPPLANLLKELDERKNGS